MELGLFGVMIIAYVALVVVAFTNPDWHTKKGGKRYDYGVAILFGFIGAYARYHISLLLNPKRNGFFLGTFTCNMIAVIGLSAMKRFIDCNDSNQVWVYAIDNGIWASLSTISSFVNDVFKGFQRANDYAVKETEKRRWRKLVHGERHESFAAGFWAAW